MAGSFSCGGGAVSAPELPASVSPGWTRKQLERSPSPPPQVAKEAAPDCWRADYGRTGASGGKGTDGINGRAVVWVCRYGAETNAFEAVQRTRTEADTVKFQEGSAFVLVHWEQVGRDEITDLIRGVQKSLKTK